MKFDFDFWKDYNSIISIFCWEQNRKHFLLWRNYLYLFIVKRCSGINWEERNSLQVHEMFPQLQFEAIVDDLRITGSIQQTTDNVLEGRIGFLGLADIEESDTVGAQKLLFCQF